jgi:hypothetical protein
MCVLVKVRADDRTLNCDDRDGPALIQVFLLAGQSNMVGQGSVEHLKLLLNDSTTNEEYSKLWDSDLEDWTTRDDVLVSFYENGSGPLTVS